MRRLAAILALLVLCGPAWAQRSRATATAIATTTSSSTAIGGGDATATGGVAVSRPTQTTSLTVGGQTTNVGGQSVNFTDPLVSTKTATQAPTVVAPSLAPAGIESCNASIALGASGPGGGAAIGLPWQDGPCNKRLDARALWNTGHRDAAMQVLCLDEDMSTALTATGYVCAIGPHAQK